MALNPRLVNESANSSGSPTGSGKNDDSPVDFIRLPECVWLRVMSFLPLSDRYYMTVSCDLFRQLFFDPSLWRSVALTCFLAGSSESPLTLVLNPSHKQIALQFGHLFRFLTLSFPHVDYPVHHETARILSAVAERSSLRGLKLMSDSVRQRKDNTAPFSHSGHAMVMDMVKKVKSLRHLDLSDWPVVGTNIHHDRVNVLNVLLDTDTCSQLRSLNVANKMLLDPDSVDQFRHTLVRLVLKFVHLRRLRVRQILLSDSLLHELASTHRDPLQSLTLLTCEPEEEEEEGGNTSFSSSSSIPISDTSWAKLRSSCPDLELHVQAEVAHVPRVRWALKPELPVVSMELLFCNLPADLLGCLEQIQPSLRSLTCHMLPGHSYDLPLTRMVTACTRLEHLEFYGKVRASTVVRLAALERQWKTFRFRLKLVVLRDLDVSAAVDRGSCSSSGGAPPPPPPSLSSSSVFPRGLSGVGGEGMVMMRGGGERGDKLQELCSSVSGFLGYPWKPCQL